MDIRLLLDFLLQGSLSERVFYLLFIKYIIVFIYFIKTLFELLSVIWEKKRPGRLSTLELICSCCAVVFLVSFFQAK